MDRYRRSMAPGIVLGVGLGAFADGIALHQIAQWHHMGSAALPPSTLEAVAANMRWDGWLHVLAWVLTLAGAYMLLRDARERVPLPGARAFTGLLLLGWGAFNLVEGIVDHHLLGIHHVRDLPVHVPIYDWTFLLVGGVGFTLLGWLLARSGAAEAERAAPPVEEHETPAARSGR